MITWVVVAIAAPPILVLAMGIVPAGRRGSALSRALESFFGWINGLQPLPRWIRFVTGKPRMTARQVLSAALYWWLVSVACAVSYSYRIVRSWVCGMRGHKFDATYGRVATEEQRRVGYDVFDVLKHGDPVYYCSRCYRWKSGPGFME